MRIEWLESCLNTIEDEGPPSGPQRFLAEALSLTGCPAPSLALRATPGAPKKAPPKRGSFTMVLHQVGRYAMLSSTQISSYIQPALREKAGLPR